jgi:hemerythrin
MPLIKWNESFSVKVKRLDDDHRKLFDLTNALFDAMRVGKGNTIIQQIVAELCDYARIHFQTEEALMERAKYEALPGHRLEHQRFFARVDEFKKQLGAGGAGNSAVVLGFLKDWLTKHIKQVDQSYSAHLNASGVH